MGTRRKSMKSVRSPRDWYEVSWAALGGGAALLLALSATPAAQGTRDPSTTLQNPSVQQGGAPAPSLPPTGQTLSERLQESRGVIKPPPGVDPDIAVPPKDPSAGANMPVIPPSQVPATSPPRTN
jgi:hypothetical protein